MDCAGCRIEKFLEKIQGTFKSDHAETGKFLILVKVYLKRGQQLAVVNQRILVAVFKVRTEQAIFNVDMVQMQSQPIQRPHIVNILRIYGVRVTGSPVYLEKASCHILKPCMLL